MIKHDIVFKNGDDQYSLVNHFKGVCESCTFPSITKFKEPHVETWYDENGSDAYISGKLYAESSELEIGIGFTGRRNTSLSDNEDLSTLSKDSPAQLKFDYLIRFLTTGSEEKNKAHLDGNGLKIFSVRDNRGLAGCYLKEIKEMDYFVEASSNEYEIMTFKLIFGVMDPTNKITLSY